MFLTWCRKVMNVNSQASRRSRKTPAGSKRFQRLRLEPLENRMAPATYTWTGLGGVENAFWSQVGNWQEQRSPAGDPDAHLVFPASSLFHTHNFDDIPNLTVSSLRFTGPFSLRGYELATVNGSSLFLGPFDSAIADETTGSNPNNTIFLDIHLASSIPRFTFTHTVSVAAGRTLHLAGSISGGTGAELHKNGPGLLLPSAVNTYQAVTVIDEGELRVDQNDQIPSASSVTVNSAGTLTVNTNSIAIGSLAGNGSVVLGGANLLVGGNNASTTFRGIISGKAGFVNKVGTGTLTLAGVNTYTTVGRTVVSGGTLQIGISGALPSDTPLQVDGTFDVNGFYVGIGPLEGTGRVTLGTGVLDNNSNGRSTTFSGVITSASFTGTEYLVKRGAGTLTLSGANTYTGATVIVGGTLLVGAANALPSDTPVLMAAALDLNNFNVTIGSLDGQGNVTLGTGTLITGGNNASTTFRGVISGTGGLTKLGRGNFTLTGQNTYVGLTRVSGGNLVVDGSQPNSNVTVDRNASLQGMGTVGAVFVSPAGAIRPGPVGNNGTLHTGRVVFQPTSFLTVNLNGPPAQNDQLSVTGTADLTGNPDLNMILNFAPAIGDSFPIIVCTGTFTGTLAGLGERGVYTSSDGTRFQIHYPGNGVVLTRIAAPADHFLVSAPSSAVAGTPFDMTVTALDPNNNIDTVYTGTISFMPSDTDPGVVVPADYPFTAADAGVHTFTDTGLGETTLITPGDQTVTVTDADGLTGSATITVTAGPLAPHGRSRADVLFGAATLSAESLPGRPATAGNVLGAAATEKQAPPLHAGKVDRLFSLTNREDYRLGLSRPQRVAWNPVQQWWEDFASYDHAPENWVA